MSWPETGSGQGDTATVLLRCGAVGPPLFAVAFLVQGALRPNYSSLRHPVSSLALGDFGWVQSVNFIVAGVLLFAFAVGLRPALRRYGGGIAAPLLVGAVAIGLVGAGVFAADPVSGYPPGTPNALAYTTRGVLHDVFSIPVFTALPAACGVLGYRFTRTGHGWLAVYSVGTAVLLLTGFALASMGFSQHAALMPVGGVIQRITLVIGLAWLTTLALWLLASKTSAHSRGAVGTSDTPPSTSM